MTNSKSEGNMLAQTPNVKASVSVKLSQGEVDVVLFILNTRSANPETDPLGAKIIDKLLGKFSDAKGAFVQ